VQVHPLSLIQFGIVLQDAEAAEELVRSEWRYRPIICMGPPGSLGTCSAAALSGYKKVQKHPVTKEILYSSHNGICNVYGSRGGLLAAALQMSKVNTVRCDFFDSSVFTVHKDDAEQYSQCLSEAWADREAAVWSHEGLKGLLEQ
jgi:hypothetical protein